MAPQDQRSTSKPEELPNGYVKFTETIESFFYNQEVRTRVVYAGPWEVKTISCFCCTCREDDYGMMSNDAACRNHGFAGTRPCDIHNLPGSEWDDEIMSNPDDKPKMPMAVNEYREAQKAGKPTW